MGRDRTKKTPRKKTQGPAPAPHPLRLTGTQQDLIVSAVLALVTVVFFWKFVFSDLMLFGSDTLPMGYMARKFYSDVLRAGSIPLWNPYILGGVPFFDSLHGDALYPATLLNFFMPVHRFIGAKLVLHVFLAGLCMYAFLRARDLRVLPAAVGGLGYMFAPYLVSLIYAGHDGKLYVTALLPLAFYCLERGLQSRRVFHFAMLGGSVGLIFLTSHVQMAAYVLWAMGLYLVVHLVNLGRWEKTPRVLVRPILLFIGGVVLGFAIGLVQFWPAYVYTKAFSPRAGGVAYEYATSWSLHPEEIASLAVPEFVHYLDDYWGRNPFKLNCEAPGLILLVLGGLALCLEWSRRTASIFAGSLVLFFLSTATSGIPQILLTLAAVVGFVLAIKRAGPLSVWVLLAVLALFYSVGAHTPVYRIFYHAIPGVKFFRAPSTIMMVFLFSSAVLAGVGADRLLAIRASGDAGRVVKGLAWVLGAGVVLLVVLALGRETLTGLWQRWVFPDLGARVELFERNYPKFLRGVVVSLGLLAGVTACAWLIGVSKIRPEWGVGGLGFLVLVSVWPFDRDFVVPVPLENYIQRDALVDRMARDPGLFRVLPVTGGTYDRNYLPVFGLETMNGFHDNRLRIYDEVTAEGRLTHPRILDLYNTKYIVTSGPVRSAALEEIASSGQRRLYLNRRALPRAFVAFNYEVIPDGKEAIDRLLDPFFDYRSTLILEREPPGLRPDSTRAPAVQEITAYGPNEIRVLTHVDAPGLLFLGDNYFPYWRAEVDGASAPLLRCDYAYRAVPVPAGTHEVVFRYRSNPLIAGAVVSGMSGALVLVSLITHLARRLRRKGDRGT